MNHRIIEKVVAALVSSGLPSIDENQINSIIENALWDTAYIPIDLEDVYCLGKHLSTVQAQAVLRLAQEQYVREAGITPDILGYHADQVLAIDGQNYQIRNLPGNYEVPKELQVLITVQKWTDAIYRLVVINSTEEEIIVIYSEKLQKGVFYDILDKCYREIFCFGCEDLIDKCLNLDGKEI